MTDNASDPKIPAFGKRKGGGPVAVPDLSEAVGEPKIITVSAQAEKVQDQGESASPVQQGNLWGETPTVAEPTVKEVAPVFDKEKEAPHHPTLPSGDTLIQEYSKVSAEKVKPVAAPEVSIVTPASEVEEASVRKIGSTTFRRLGEPVEIEAAASEPAVEIQPVKIETVTPEPEVMLEPETTPEPEVVSEPELTSEPASQQQEEEAAAEPIPEPLTSVEPESKPEPDSESEPTEEELALSALIEEPEITDEMIESLEEDAKAEVAKEQESNPEAQAVMAEMPAPEVAAGEVAATAVPVHHAGDSVTALLDEHVQWLDSGGAEGRRAVFREVDLKGTDFSGKRLSGAVFRGLDLTHCRFTQAELVETDFADCQLHGADFTAAVMDRAILQNAIAVKAAFTAAQLNGADLQSADLTETDFMQAKLQEANFRDAVLTKAKLPQVIASLANFRNAKMEEVVLDQADLTQAIFREAVLAGASLEQANLVRTDFKDANLKRVNLNDTDFSQAVEISEEVQSRYMQDQRAKIQEQEAQFERIRSELEQRERSLIEEREQLQRQLQLQQLQAQEQPTSVAPDFDPLVGKVGKTSKAFLFLGIGWFVLTFLLAIILQGVFSQIDSDQLSLGEIALMGLLLIGPLVLFVVSMAKCFSLSHALQRVSKPDLNEPQ